MNSHLSLRSSLCDNASPDANEKATTAKNTPTIYILRRNSGSGGAEGAAERLASGLEQHFTVVRLWAGEVFEGRVIPGRGGPPWWRSWRYTRFIDSLNLKNRGLVFSLEYGPDCHIYRAGDGVHRLNVKRRYGKNPKWMVNPWHWFAPRLEKKCLRSADVIVANSDLVAELIRNEYPPFSSKVERIYNGFNAGVFNINKPADAKTKQALQLPVQGKILLFAGHGFKRKGLHHAIELLSVLKTQHNDEAHLLVVGKGDADYVKPLIDSKGLSHQVHFCGSRSNMQDYYRIADVMVLPTRHDPFSNACLEALACGCPVVTSEQNGVAEVITPNTGFVFKRYTPQEFKAAAEFVVHHSASRQMIADTVKRLDAECELNAYLSLIKTMQYGSENYV